MSLKTFKPYTKSRRSTVLVDRGSIWKGKPFKSLLKKNKSSNKFIVNSEHAEFKPDKTKEHGIQNEILAECYNIDAIWLGIRAYNLLISNSGYSKASDWLISETVGGIELLNCSMKSSIALCQKIGKIGKSMPNSNNYNVNEYCWTADPIDGTSNYAKGDEKFAIMLSLSFTFLLNA